MNKKLIGLFFASVILFTAGCDSEAINGEETSENKMSEPEVSSTVEESDKPPRAALSMLEGEWSSLTNQINVVLKNEEQQHIEVEAPYMVGRAMFLTDYDQQSHTYAFENKEELIHFQVLNEQAAIIWYGTTKEETTGVSAPIEYTKKEASAFQQKD